MNNKGKENRENRFSLLIVYNKSINHEKS